VPSTVDARLNRVIEQLKLYEHPLLTFEAHAKSDGVEVAIRVKNPAAAVHTYTFEMHPRDLDQAQFAWVFEHQLYDSLHDYLIEMFTRTPKLHDAGDGRPR
jgi:hypothetical protein